MNDRIYLEKVVKVAQIKQGDSLVVSDGRKVICTKAKKVIINDIGETEIILKRRTNIYFIVEMYFSKVSWVKEVCIVRLKVKDI